MLEGHTKNKRSIFAEKTMDWGNLVFIGLVIGQLVPGSSPFRLTLLILGVLGMAGAYAFAYLLMKGGGGV